ncbi:MAG: outer membrane lipoprotein-sorting protein [Halobacteriovoraceae bacterium]|nr:outer membrane lipoprotein-sorting protein [Halobacteriovoraceae bacterium]MCB9095315.1 outer membrane lipoprotein-sorting protein [Halobacteriovoraceae bacterium]
MKFLTMLLLLTLNWNALAISVDEIVQKTNHNSYYRGKDGRAEVKMVIKDSQGRERKRSFTILRLNTGKNKDGKQKFYVYFKRPSDVKKMAFLVWKQINQEDDRWMYFPSLDLVKRIAGADKRTSFVGSDFFYEDVSGRNIDADKHELLETSDNYFVIKNTPKDVVPVEFSYFKMWIHKTSFLPIKSEYYDKAGKLYRTYEVAKVDTIQDKPTVTKAIMKDLNKKTETELSYSKVEYDVGLSEDIFTERYLRNPPVKEMKF